MRLRLKKTSSPDYFFIGLVLFLVILGFVMLTSASSEKGEKESGDSYFYLKHQIINGVLPGLVGFIITSFFFYRRLAKFALIFLILNLVLLLLLFTDFGVTAKGATRWLSISGFSFQPSEILKLTFLIYLAAWLSKDATRLKNARKGFFSLIFLLGFIALLLLLQPSTTTAVLIFAVSIIMYFLSGAHFKFILGAGLVAILCFGLLLVFGGKNYRFERIKTFLKPVTSEEIGSGYQITQTLTSIGSGGIYGIGFGQSKAKISYLPEPIADSIFAVIAEENGFIGSMFLILLFFLLIWRGLKIAKASPDGFGKILVVGFISLMGLQAFINIAAVSGLIPLTGVPLPFISYGGTALAVFLTMSGIIVNISKYRR